MGGQARQSRWGIPAGIVGAAVFSAAGWQTFLAPSWPDYQTVALLTFVSSTLAYVATWLLLAERARNQLQRTGRGLLTLVVPVLAVYAFLWAGFTYRITDSGQRVVGGWVYTPLALEYRELQGRSLSAGQLLADMGNDPDLVFTWGTLSSMRFLFLGSWLASSGGLFGLLALGVLLTAEPGNRSADPLLTRLLDRLSALPADGPDKLCGELHLAVATLERANNAAGAILTVAGLLEGRHGLLGAVASGAGQELKGFNLLDQIEELSQKGLLPGEVASDCHWIRLRSNMARHRKEAVTADDAHVALNRAVHVVEWYLCRCEQGPHLPPPQTPEPLQS